jgi:hypothetical protein
MHSLRLQLRAASDNGDDTGPLQFHLQQAERHYEQAKERFHETERRYGRVREQKNDAEKRYDKRVEQKQKSSPEGEV